MTSGWREAFGSVDYGNSRERSLARRGILSTASVAIQGVIRLLYSILVGRLLGPTLLALTNSAISLAQFASVLWPTASGSAATKFVSRAKGANDNALAQASAAHLARGVMVAAVLLGCGTAAYSYFVGVRGDIPAAVLVGLLTIVLSGYNFIRGVYFALGLLTRAVAWDTICAVLGVGLLLTVVVLHWTAALLVPLIIVYGAYSLAGWPRGHGGVRLPRSLRREMNAFIVWTSFGTLATGGFLQLSMVVAQTIASGTASGLYAAALSLATPASLVSSVLTLMLFPRMAHATGRRDFDSVRRQTNAATRGAAALLGGVFGALILVAQPLIDLFFGAAFEEAAPLLRILLLASLVLTLNVGAVNALLAGSHRTVRIPSILSACGMAVGLLSMAALAPTTSVTGVSVGYLIGSLVSGFGPVLVVWRRNQMRWRSLWLRFGLGLLVVALLLVASSALSWGFGGDIAAALAFLGVWAGLMNREIRVIVSMRKTAA